MKQNIYTQKNIDEAPQAKVLSQEQLFEIKLMARILPFRVNNYVLDQLIDWENAPDDPIFRMMFPNREMISTEDYNKIESLVQKNAPEAEIERCAYEIRTKLNPHPSGQAKYNVPEHNGTRLEGAQHKYKETVLLFPSEGKICFSYCMFCFRWAQFVETNEPVFLLDNQKNFFDYLATHKDITDLLITGGDPMVMKASTLEQYINELCKPQYDHIKNIRIGTKSLSFWPHRFTSDPDADDLLALFEKLIKAGKHVAFMVHFNHYREMENKTVSQAIERIKERGIILRSQSPILRNVNDNPAIWAKLWRKQLAKGIIPYYMFIERNTGANQYYELPLVQIYEIFRKAVQEVSGLGRTVKGPVMSANIGKVEILGKRKVAGEEALVLRYVQCRDPELNYIPFLAESIPGATWFDDLKPLEKSDEIFFKMPGEDDCDDEMAS